MSAPVPDEKIQAVVGLVLHAVDQRLTTVRDQLAQLANAVNRNHADLGAQIEQCRKFASAAGSPPGRDAAASLQLVEAANMLTERVTHLEARVNQYTNDRIAELYAAIQDIISTQVPVVASISAPVPITAPGAPARAALTPAAPAPAPPAPAATSIEELTAQMSERLAVLVDRALGS